MPYRPNCPAPGCKRTVSAGKLMCPPHWGAVRPDLQRAVYKTWRAWQKDKGNAALFREYRSATQAALEEV